MQTVRIPECRLARVMTEIVMQILGLRVKFGKRKGILLQKMDAKSAFRQGGVTPDRAVAFAYRLGDLIFIDFAV